MDTQKARAMPIGLIHVVAGRGRAAAGLTEMEGHRRKVNAAVSGITP